MARHQAKLLLCEREKFTRAHTENIFSKYNIAMGNKHEKQKKTHSKKQIRLEKIKKEQKLPCYLIFGVQCIILSFSDWILFDFLFPFRVSTHLKQIHLVVFAITSANTHTTISTKFTLAGHMLSRFTMYREEEEEKKRFFLQWNRIS